MPPFPSVHLLRYTKLLYILLPLRRTGMTQWCQDDLRGGVRSRSLEAAYNGVYQEQTMMPPFPSPRQRSIFPDVPSVFHAALVAKAYQPFSHSRLSAVVYECRQHRIPV